MPISTFNLTPKDVVNMLTVCWVLTCTSCSEMNFVSSGLGLTEFPLCLQENIIKLDLSNNSITTVNRDDLRTLKKVKIIDMSYNKIEIVHADTFEDAGDLEVLNLSYNNISNLSPNIFHSNKKLTNVHLNNNMLQMTRNFRWKEHILESTSLTYLDVSFCNIASISNETFSGLPNLETLKMNGNPLTQFDVEFINPLKNLKIIHIQFNSSTFKKFCNHLINYKKLILSPPCPSASITRLRNRVETDLNILTAGTIMCACAFLIIVIVYLLITRCKTRISNAVDTKEHDSENTIHRSRLPQSAEPNDMKSPIRHVGSH
jgi:Leucine-rich repeat (LRR) protein